MSTYTISAIILQRKPIGENDKRLTLLSAEKGKVYAVARGARKAGAKLSGLTEPPAVSRFMLAKGRSNDIVTQVQPIHAYVNLRTDSDKLMCCLYWLELLSAVSMENCEDIAEYELAVNILNLLEENENPRKTLLWGEMQLLKVMGYNIVADACVKCGKSLKTDQIAFDADSGGFICGLCLLTLERKIYVPINAVSSIQIGMARSDYSPQVIKGFDLSATVCIRHFWQHILECELHTAKYLEL